LLRLGVLVDFLSHPVIIGFTSAAALIIATSQISKLFGVTAEKGASHLESVWNVIVAAVHEFHPMTIMFSLLALAIIIGMKKISPRAPGVLVAVVVTTLLSWLLGYAAGGGAVVGDIPRGLPSLHVPHFDFTAAGQLFAGALVISLFGFIEAVSIGKVLAARKRQRFSPNQELVGQGLANIASAFSGGYPVSGSFSRSAISFESGAVTGFATIVSGLMVGLTLLFLTPLLYHLPQATLAAIIIVAVITLVRFGPMLEAWRIEKHDGFVAFLTFVLTLALAPRLERGIIVSVVLAMALFIYRTMRPRIAVMTRHPDGTLRDVKVHPHLKRCKRILIVRFYMSLYYANAGYFETKLLQLLADHPDVTHVIIDADPINRIDASGVEMLTGLIEQQEEAGVRILIAHMNKNFMDALIRSGRIERLGGEGERFFGRLTHALKKAWSEVECDVCGNGAHCPLHMPKTADIAFEEDDDAHPRPAR
ncbi:MAG TPA: SulP family inorganic anion transporter, partial [Thermopetrobacter sp.]|nr:SulP family inorganic anion transporter [Thermopetrobacter sp.]